MGCVIQVLGIAGQPLYEGDVYLQEFEIDTNDGKGYSCLTTEITKAYVFKSQDEAIETWKQQSKTMPLRPDLMPNRPLTSYTITFVKVGI